MRIVRTQHELKTRMAWNEATVQARTNFVETNKIKNGMNHLNEKWDKLPLEIRDEIMKYYKPLLY